MRRFIFLSFLPLLLWTVFSCSKDPNSLSGDPVPLHLEASMGDPVVTTTTRTDYLDQSEFQAWLTDGWQTAKTVRYTYNGTSWIADPANPEVIVFSSGGSTPAKAFGTFSTSDYGYVPGVFIGNLSYTVSGGSATATVPFEPASSLLEFVLKDPLAGVTLDGANFTLTGSELKGVTGAWSGLPDAPTLMPVTLTDKALGKPLQVVPTTVDAGDVLFTLTCKTAEGTIKAGDSFTLTVPTATDQRTFTAGKRHTVTIELGAGRQAAIVSVTVSDFEDGDPINIGNMKGIFSQANFIQFAADYNADPGGAMARWADNGTVNLWADIDLENTEVKINGFTSRFNGNGHTLSGLQNTSGALFSSIASASVVENLHVQGETTFGGIANFNYGTISGCSFTGTVGGGGDVGGVASSGSGKIIGCTFSGTVTATANGGGIAGWFKGTIAGCRVRENSTVTTTGSHTSHGAGAIVGCLEDDEATAKVVGCYSLAGTISSSGAPIGGIVGRNGGAEDPGLVTCSFWLSGGQAYAIGYDNGQSGPFTPADCGTFADKAGFIDRMIADMNTALTDADVKDYEWQRPADGEYPVMVAKQ